MPLFTVNAIQDFIVRHGCTVTVEAETEEEAINAAKQMDECGELVWEPITVLDDYHGASFEALPGAEYGVDTERELAQGACILTAENMHTADDCTMHDHEPV